MEIYAVLWPVSILYKNIKEQMQYIVFYFFTSNNYTRKNKFEKRCGTNNPVLKINVLQPFVA